MPAEGAGHGGRSHSPRSTSCPSLLRSDFIREFDAWFKDFGALQRARHARALQNREQRILNARQAQYVGGDLVPLPRGPEKDGYTFGGIPNPETED